MRQHALLSCFVLLFGWVLFFGLTIFQAIYAIPELHFKILMAVIIPSCLTVIVWQRHKLQKIVFSANVWGFMGLLALLGLRLWAELMQYSGVQLTAILLMPTFIVLGSLGLKAFGVCFFPCVALLLAHPGCVAFPAWFTAHFTTFMQWVAPWPVNSDAMPLLQHSLHALVLTAFYGHLRYAGVGQRFGFYGVCVAVLLGVVGIQTLGLAGLYYCGGQDLVSRFNLWQFNQVLLLLGIAYLAYALSVLVPYKAPLRHMMRGSQNFLVLVDRHSHWFALTLTALLLMGLSVWLGSNIYQMSLSVMEIWH